MPCLAGTTSLAANSEGGRETGVEQITAVLNQRSQCKQRIQDEAPHCTIVVHSKGWSGDESLTALTGPHGHTRAIELSSILLRFYHILSTLVPSRILTSLEEAL